MSAKYQIAALMSDGSRFILQHRPADTQHDRTLMQEGIVSMAQRGVWVSITENRGDTEPNIVHIPVFYPPTAIVRFEVETIATLVPADPRASV